MKSMLLLVAVATGLVAEQILWEAKPGFRDFGKIAVGGGVVVSGNINGRGGTFAFDAGTGKLLWRAPGHMKAGPVMDGKVVYTLNTGVGLSAFELRTGRVLWKAAEAEVGDYVDLLLGGGKVFATSGYGKLRAYEAATGKLAWEHRHIEGGYRASCPTTPVGGEGLVYYASGDSQDGVFVRALDVASGREVWRYAAKQSASTRNGDCVKGLAVSGGIVALTSGAVMIGVDAKTGAERWRTKPVEAEDREMQLGQPVVHEGRVYALHRFGVVGWNLTDGRQEFVLNGIFTDANGVQVLEFGGGAVYVVGNVEGPKGPNDKGHIYAVDLATKQVRMKHRVNRDVKYQDTWSTSYFKLEGGDLYYENYGMLVKLRL